jgi:hypothetical protein
LHPVHSQGSCYQPPLPSLLLPPAQLP